MAQLDIFDAIYQSDGAALQSRAATHLAAGRDIHFPLNSGRRHTPCHVAAQCGDPYFVRALAELRADLDRADRDGHLPLHIAAENGHEACIRALVECRAELSGSWWMAETPCHNAAQEGHEWCVRALATLRADVHCDGLGCTACHLAAHYGHESCVRVLKEFGADTSVLADDGRPPIFAAVEQEHVGVIQLLIDYGDDCGSTIVADDFISIALWNEGTVETIIEEYAHTHALQEDFRQMVELVKTTISRCQDLQSAARIGNEDDVRRLIHGQTNMVLDGVHAADVASDHGHSELADSMRELWTSVYRSHGYKRYNELQAQRARWQILRNRLSTQRFESGETPTERPIRMTALEWRRLDWLIVGTDDICPDDVFSVIMGYWNE